MDEPAPLAFDADWREDLALADGTRVRLRLLQPSDKAKLEHGLAQLSPHSRYLRFFTDKARLSEAELRYLTELDQHDHFALAAGLLDAEGQEGDGVGIARFVRLPGEPEVAEPAVAVVDAMQGKGVGRLLMSRLVAAAAERGVRRFRTDLLAINRPMRQLVVELSPHATFHAEGPVVTAEFPLPHADGSAAIESSPQYQPLLKILKMMAEQVVELQRRIVEHLDPRRLRDSLVRLGQHMTGKPAPDSAPGEPKPPG